MASTLTASCFSKIKTSSTMKPKLKVKHEYISVGGNRHPGAADWDQYNYTDVLAFGADNNIAFWEPLDPKKEGIFQLLSGHSAAVNVVKFLPGDNLLSGSDDKTIRLWRLILGSDGIGLFRPIKCVDAHQSSVKCMAVLGGSDIFVSGAADGTVHIWRLDGDDIILLQAISLSPKYFPLALSLARLDDKSYVLAVGGTRNSIQVYTSKNDEFSLAATLSGHEGWIRSLAFTKELDSDDLLLASASQDRYIRLWRVHQGLDLPASRAADPTLGILGKSLSNKAHRFEVNEQKYSVTFEALLLGHEDWIFSASWHTSDGKLQLLTASADNSLSIWEVDPQSGIWMSVARLGDVSAQKGSTTATGSTGGFWTGLWSPEADAVVSLGRTGSWRLWRRGEQWTQDVGVSGHTGEVKALSFAGHTYMLSTGFDQTTRLHAEWERDGLKSWHEFSRPQIHGYDLNCIASVDGTRFVSGADEKLLRVFQEPAAVADMLHRLCDIVLPDGPLPDAANIPVLGLSNKTIEDAADEENPTPAPHKAVYDLSHPPLEDQLARHMLWPEVEKLYGHGYEISAVAASEDGRFVATACRASSIDHAVIRLYDTRDWYEIKPALRAHSLTVTAMEFSYKNEFLLSVGRDRQWALWKKNKREEWGLGFSNPKAHARMILDAAWAPPCAGLVFATAGRDKVVKVWEVGDEEVQCVTTITAEHPVTAVAFHHLPICDSPILAYGLETGGIVLCRLRPSSLEMMVSFQMDALLAPSKAVNQLAWRFGNLGNTYLAAASDDTSVRVFNVDVCAICGVNLDPDYNSDDE
ncbi:putative RNA polymerase II Elongator subunit [Trichodelitschia bisporula]|uniref:Elongator complex protein 2 n=1 Tax=Trichodelitschia bisporula TaxID=703511 RepID=A0A6G1HPD4_9PEZI|nr:putative RNA polymerase II Elongator subunit [Trichodelitschia bisporula]